MFTAIKYIYSFLWEYFFGKDNLQTSYKKSKSRLVMFIIIIILLIYSIFTTKRLYNVSADLVELRKQCIVETKVTNVEEKEYNRRDEILKSLELGDKK